MGSGPTGGQELSGLHAGWPAALQNTVAGGRYGSPGGPGGSGGTTVAFITGSRICTP
jgi:hypothetical protein